MLAGQRPFKGSTDAEVAASILRDAPPLLSSIVPGLPSSLSRVVGRCLARDETQRYASTTDLAHVVADARADLEPGTTPSSVAVTRSRAMPMSIMAMAIVALLGVVVVTTWLRGDRPPTGAAADRLRRAVVVLPFTTIGTAEQSG